MQGWQRLVFGAVCAALSAAAMATPRAPSDERRIAITVDDLPWQRIEQTPAAELPARTHS